MRCMHPIELKNPRFMTGVATKTTKMINVVPCGKCPACLLNRRNSWVFRLQQEALSSLTPPYFVTFTYNDENLPFNSLGFPYPRKRDFQLFLKRLRHSQTQPIKYYCISEYGGHTNRPHFHALIFNLVDPLLLSKFWNLGNILVGDVTIASIKYVCAYHSILPSDRKPNKNYEDCFSLVSKGIGISYLSEANISYHRSHRKDIFITIQNGVKVPFSRYYRDKLDFKLLPSEVDFNSDVQSFIDRYGDIKKGIEQFNAVSSAFTDNYISNIKKQKSKL